MADIEVIEVETRLQLDEFITYPWRLYQSESNFIRPLLIERRAFFNKQTNPFYKTARTRLFLARRGAETVGRIASCVNFSHNEYHNEKTGFFGFLDAPEDQEVVETLLRVAMIHLKKEGMERMRGPMNFSTNHEIGFLVDGFESPPTVMMTWNPPYLPRLCEQFGLKKVMDLNAYYMTREQGIPERIRKVVERTRKRNNFVVRPMNFKAFDAELQRLLSVYNQAWAPNWGFVPMSSEEFIHMGKDLKQIADPNLVLLVEHNDKPVAFCIGLPDINQALKYLDGSLFPLGLLKLLWHTKVRNKVTGMRMITMGVIPEYQKKGVDLLLFAETFRAGIAGGYHWAELSWILEANELMCRGAVDMGGRLYKRYRILEMPL